MAVKNMQTLETRVANLQGVSVTGLECKGSQRIDGKFQAPILSLFRLPLPGPYPMPTDGSPCADNSATANAVERTGRSASGAGELARAELARIASRTMPSTWSPSLTASKHRERKAIFQACRPSCRFGTFSARG